MSVGDIDSTLPIGLMHLVDRKHEVVHQHGGIATAVNFDSFEEMSLDDFINNVVPTLKNRKDYFTVIKDSTREQMLRILGDNVAMYHIKSIQDVFFDDFVARLLSGQKISITPNLKYPLIRWACGDDGMKDITVEIPPQQFGMQVDGFTSRFLIYHPRLWLRVVLTAANATQVTRFAVVREHINDLDKGRLYRMPFPNVYDGGDVCWGHTSYDVPKGVKLTENVAIELTYQRFFNSQFNFDLVRNRDMREMNKLYDRLPKDPEFEKLLQRSDRMSSESIYLCKMGRCFKTVEEMLQFEPTEFCSAKDFLSIRDEH